MRPLPRPTALLSVVLLLAASWATASPAGASDRSSGEAGSGPAPRAVRRSEGTVAWADVPRNHWARWAIDLVAGTHAWMRDFDPLPDGTYPFRPDRLEPRRLFARALVRAFARGVEPDPSISFDDLEPGTAAYRDAATVVTLRWMRPDGASFRPRDPVTTREVHRALVLALGLRREAAGLDALHTSDGRAFDTPRDFGTLLLGMRLGLRFNHSDEALDVGPGTPLPRAEVAWSLARAATVQDWQLTALAPYASITLPRLSRDVRRVVDFGIRAVGAPYVWGGEWWKPTPDGYCCGAQPVGGFDCSGLMWWVLKAPTSWWDNVPPRPYPGWRLDPRSSADMARSRHPLAFADVRPGDLLFYDGDGDGGVDHVNLYLGKGWALDSSGSAGGTSILSVRSGWYRDHFVWGRRVIR